MNAVKRAVVGGLSVVPGVVFAAQDYSGVQTALMAEIAAALVVALVIFGAVGGISVAFRLIKKAFGA